MPANVANAVLTTVLPFALSRRYTRTLEWPLRSVEYADGTSQRTTLAATARRAWRIGRRVVHSELTELRNFWEARGGEAFIFYDVMEDALNGYRYDETGVAAYPHKYAVQFGEQPWTQSVGIVRGETDFVLVEVT